MRHAGSGYTEDRAYCVKRDPGIAILASARRKHDRMVEAESQLRGTLEGCSEKSDPQSGGRQRHRWVHRPPQVYLNTGVKPTRCARPPFIRLACGLFFLSFTGESKCCETLKSWTAAAPSR